MDAVEQAVNDIRYPDMRAEVLGALQALSDPEYQQRVWVRHELPAPNHYDEFKYRIHILYDDTTVFENPQVAIGDILRGEEEVQALTPLKDALDSLFDKYGTKLADEEYLGLPEWAAVVEAAQAALDVFITAED